MEYQILICKDTQHLVGGINFYGFWCESLYSATELPARKIECYGESATTGSCMVFGTPCTLANNGANWDAASSAYLSYGAVAARALNAQWQITAEGGIGLIQSCCSKGYTLPDVYDRLDLNNAAVKWDFTRYVPDVVTICLGSNDGGTKVALPAFKYKYVEFINTLRSKYPNASIICVTTPAVGSYLVDLEKAVLARMVDSINTAGVNNQYWLELPHDQTNGCTGLSHPSETEQATTASVLEAFIRQKMGW
jgi:lysophospholipase L1-like esterase